MTRCAALLLVLPGLFLWPAQVGAQVLVPAQVAPGCPELPANMLVAGISRAWVVDIIARSSTMRRQCDAIARARHVSVHVSFGRRIGGHCRARSTVTLGPAGRLRARVDVPVSIDAAELLAHELEHIVEQIEGLNLRALSRTADSGVREVGQNVFETARAIRAGREAAGEVMACRSAREACAEGRVASIE